METKLVSPCSPVCLCRVDPTNPTPLSFVLKRHTTQLDSTSLPFRAPLPSLIPQILTSFQGRTLSVCFLWSRHLTTIVVSKGHRLTPSLIPTSMLFLLCLLKKRAQGNRWAHRISHPQITYRGKTNLRYYSPRCSYFPRIFLWDNYLLKLAFVPPWSWYWVLHHESVTFS